MNTSPPLDALWYQATSLGIVALVAAASLASVNQATSPAIDAAQRHDLATSLQQVLPAGFSDNDMLADTVEVTDASGNKVKVHQAKKNGEVAGVIFETAKRGYAGPIQVVMGVDRDGKVLGVRVLRHTETPGLGDKIEASRSDWIFSFNGKRLGDPEAARWAVKKDGGVFDQFAGATITPRAVVNAVKSGLELFAAQRETMLTPKTGEKNS